MIKQFEFFLKWLKKNNLSEAVGISVAITLFVFLTMIVVLVCMVADVLLSIVKPCK